MRRLVSIRDAKAYDKHDIHASPAWGSLSDLSLDSDDAMLLGLLALWPILRGVQA